MLLLTVSLDFNGTELAIAVKGDPHLFDIGQARLDLIQ